MDSSLQNEIKTRYSEKFGAQLEFEFRGSRPTERELENLAWYEFWKGVGVYLKRRIIGDKLTVVGVIATVFAFEKLPQSPTFRGAARVVSGAAEAVCTYDPGLPVVFTSGSFPSLPVDKNNTPHLPIVGTTSNTTLISFSAGATINTV